MIRVLLGLLLIFASLPQAQSDDETAWYYAHSREGSLIAFTLDGEVRDLGMTSLPQGLRYIDEQRALAQIQAEDGTYSLQIVSPDGLQVLAEGLTSFRLPIAYSDPYVVMKPILLAREAQSSLLIDLSSGTVTELTIGNERDVVNCCAFSEDGSVLRYVARTNGASPRVADFELRERDLATGTETTFYTFEMDRSNTINFESSFTGDEWLVRISTEDVVNESREITYQLVDTTGEIDTLETFNTIDEAFPLYRLLDDAIMTWDARCEADCTITLADDEAIISFNAGEDPRAALRPVFLFENHLTAETGEAVIRYSTDAEPEILGYYDPSRIDLVGGQNNPRWSVLADSADDPQNLLVWDHTQAEPIYTMPLPDSFDSFISAFTVNTFLVVSPPSRGDGLVVINTESGAIIEWPPLELERASTPVVLSDDLALVQVFRADIEVGIYLLERESGDLTLLVPGELRLLSLQRIESAVSQQ